MVVVQDLPITKGVQERMREFDKLEEAEEIRELLRQVVRNHLATLRSLRTPSGCCQSCSAG